MTTDRTIETVDRRIFLCGAGAAVAAGLGLDAAALAQDKGPAGWEEAVKKIVGTAKVAEGKVKLDLPEIAENGNTVPFTVAVESPMTEQLHVKSIHIVSTGNPQPSISRRSPARQWSQAACGWPRRRRSWVLPS
jgi:sulfur-oxidizing protein SoxY